VQQSNPDGPGNSPASDIDKSLQKAWSHEEKMSQDTATIVNLTEQSWVLQRSYGVFAVSAREPGESYSLTRVTARKALMDLGDKRTLDVPISAREVAEDLCHEINDDGGDDSFFGVFMTKGSKPTAAELSEAQERLTAFYQRLVAVADREWERSHSYLFINDVQRRAARHLGLDKEWHYQPRETLECEGCGEKVKPHVAVCRSCGNVINREKAVKLGLASAEGAAPGAVTTRFGARRLAVSAEPVSS
jgi:hypothetical protein